MRAASCSSRTARALLEETPDLDQDSLRRLMVRLVGPPLGIADSSPVYDQALRAIVDNPDTAPPTAVGGDRPPRAGEDDREGVIGFS